MNVYIFNIYLQIHWDGEAFWNDTRITTHIVFIWLFPAGDLYVSQAGCHGVTYLKLLIQIESCVLIDALFCWL